MTADCAIKEKFRELVSQVPYAKITVSMICRQANVSRKTFYYYFESKDDIVIKLYRDDFVFPVYAVRDVLPLQEIKSSTRLMIDRLYNKFAEHMDYYDAVIKGIGQEPFVRMSVAESGAVTNAASTWGELPQLEREYVASVLSAAQAYSFIWWLDGHRDITPKQMADWQIRWLLAGGFAKKDRFTTDNVSTAF
jgi:AcrR family transcriptional regulator